MPRRVLVLIACLVNLPGPLFLLLAQHPDGSFWEPAGQSAAIFLMGLCCYALGVFLVFARKVLRA